MIYCHQIKVGDLLRFRFKDPIARDDWFLVTEFHKSFSRIGILPATFAWKGYSLQTGAYETIFVLELNHKSQWDCFRDGKKIRLGRRLTSDEMELQYPHDQSA